MFNFAISREAHFSAQGESTPKIDVRGCDQCGTPQGLLAQLDLTKKPMLDNRMQSAGPPCMHFIPELKGYFMYSTYINQIFANIPDSVLNLIFTSISSFYIRCGTYDLDRDNV